MAIPVQLFSLRGQTVVLYFYPRADTLINSVEGPLRRAGAPALNARSSSAADSQCA